MRFRIFILWILWITCLSLANVARAVTKEKNLSEGKMVKVASVQAISEFGDPAKNRAHLEKLIREAAKNGAKIVVLPETAITGYMSHDIKKTWHKKGMTVTDGLQGVPFGENAETVPGASTGAFAALSKELGIYLTVPLAEIEKSTGNYFNTLVLVDPNGKLLLHYRKLNPWPFAEQGWATKGDRGHQFVDTPYGRLALLICFDINFEPPALAEKKVDILLYSIAWVDKAGSPWFRVNLPSIAKDNHMNIIGANWTVPGKPEWYGYGQSLIIGKDGGVLARVSNDLIEEIIYAELPVNGTH